MGPMWGPSRADRTQVGPMLAPWTVLSGYTDDRYPGVHPQWQENASFLSSKFPDKIPSTHTYFPDSKVHGANMGPIGGWQGPGGPHVGPMNFAIWVCTDSNILANTHQWIISLQMIQISNSIYVAPIDSLSLQRRHIPTIILFMFRDIIW